MRALLIGLTGADWNVIDPLLEEGAMPFLSSLIAEGYRTGCAGLAPHVPALSWASALTGERAWKHGVLDESMQPLVPLLWDHVASNASRPLLVGWPTWQSPSAGIQVPESFFQTEDSAIRRLIAGSLAEDLAELQVNEESLDPEVIRWLCPDLTPQEAGLDPKAGRLARAVSILYSLHHSSSSLMETEDWDLSAVRIPFLSHLAGDFLIHQTAPDLVPSAEKVRYQHLHRRSYQLLDLLLSELVAAAGDNVSVFIFSPQGIGGANSSGIFVASGKGIHEGAKAAAISITDTMPSVLHSMGLPIPENIAGRVANGLHEKSPETFVAAETGMLGRLPEANHPHAAWCLGVDLMDAGNASRALPLLTRSYLAEPESAVQAYWLARCQFRLGMIDEARATCDVIRDHLPESSLCEYFLGILALENGWYDDASEHLRQARDVTEAKTFEAVSLLGSGDLVSAVSLLEELISESPNAIAWFGLGKCRYDFGLYESAASAARSAIALQPMMVDAWILLEKSLGRIHRGSEEAKGAGAEAARLREAMEMGAPSDGGRLFSGRVAGAFRKSSLRLNHLIYRQPDEDETVRADSLLRLPVAPDANRWNRRVWQVDSPGKRLAGAAIWRPPGPGEPASVHLKVMPRYLAGPEAAMMMDELLREVAEAGVTSPEVLLDRREPWEEILLERGLIWKSCDELWTGVDIRRALSRVRKSRMKGSGRTDGWKVRAIEGADHETISAWCVEAGYVPSGHFSDVIHQLDPYVSGIAESPDGIEGVLLATRRGMGHIIEFLGGHPDRTYRWPVVTWMLFERFGHPPQGGVPGDSATITTSPGKGVFARAMSIRLGGRLVDSIHRFEMADASSTAGGISVDEGVV